jgi:hypothetical protein
MKKKLVLSAIALGLVYGLSSCCKTTTTAPVEYCHVVDPINEISWLKSVIAQNPTKTYVYKATYHNMEGFEVIYCLDTACLRSGASTYRDCNNNIICDFGAVQGYCPDFGTKANNIIRIYPK